MQNYIFYQTENAVGFVDTKHFGHDMYSKEYKPLLYKILSCTDDGINAIMDMRYENTEKFVEIMKEELSFDVIGSN